MEKQFEFIHKHENKDLLQSGVVQYDYNLFYEKKRMTPLEEKVHNFIFLGIIAIMTLIVGYDTYNMYEKIKDKEIISAIIEEGVIKLLPANPEINRTKNR